MKKILLLPLWLLLFCAASAQQFSLPIQVSGGANSLNLTIGIHPNGETGYVEGLDVFAPPAPPEGAFDTRIIVAGEAYFTKLLDNTITEKVFEIRYAAAEGQGPITLTWDHAALISYGTFTITDQFGGDIYSADMADFNGQFTPSNAHAVLQSGLILRVMPNEEIVDPTASAPVFTPSPGTYSGAVTVSMQSPTPGSSIYYTLNGSDPDTNDELYTSPIVINEPTEIRAITVAPGYQNSSVSVGFYDIDDSVSDLEFALPFFVSDGQNGLNLTVGIHPQGDTGFVEGLDMYAPPAPPEGAYDSRIVVGGEAYFIKFKDNTLTEKVFEIRYAAAEGEGPIVITWNHEAMLSYGTFTATDQFGGGIFSADLADYNGEFIPVAANAVLQNGLILRVMPHADIDPTEAEAPEFSPLPGTYIGSVDVTMTTATPGGQIFYTINGEDPDENSELYTTPVTLTESATVRAITIASGFLNSEITSGFYDIEPVEPPQAEAPTFLPEPGTYVGSVDVAMATETPGGLIFYTINGENPDENSELYTTPITLTESATLRAITILDGYLNSTVSVGEYFIDPLTPGNFSLINPEDGSAFTTIPGSETVLTTEWGASENAETYTWMAITEDGDFNNPLIEAASDNSGVATTLTLTLGEIDSILAEQGLNPGESITLLWTVRADLESFSQLANSPFSITFTRASASAEVNPDSIEIELMTGTSEEVMIEISNNGLVELEVAISVRDESNWLIPDNEFVSVEPGGNTQILFTIDAEELGTGVYTDIIELATNVPDNPLIEIPVNITVTPDTGTGEDAEVPTVFVLKQNYPNPFNPVTIITYGLPEAADVRIEVFNMMGQRVATLVNGMENAGYHSVAFNAGHLSSGMYLYRIQARDFTDVRKMLLLK